LTLILLLGLKARMIKESIRDDRAVEISGDRS